MSAYKSLSGATDDNDSDEENINAPLRNRQRVLMLSSRGVTHRQVLCMAKAAIWLTFLRRHRHLLNDLHALLPHSRKDSKLDTKTKLYQLNELADLYNCNNVLFFEARKGKDLYVWLAKAPNGPTIKLHLHNLHTMSELHFPGNCLKGSRPILSFDSRFQSQPHFLLLKELLAHTFGVPNGARKVKPFVDHVMSFTIAGGKVWVRCYEIKETEVAKGGRVSDRADGLSDASEGDAAQSAESGGKTKVSLTEIGPRFVLTPIVILEGSFGGPVIYENKEFVSPNQVRADMRLRRSGKFARRSERISEGTAKKRGLGLASGGGKRKRENDELEDTVLFA